MLRINKISITNFRQYKNIVLEFPEQQTHDLNYILAENGIGKTTLLNAITWCLYNEELHITKGLEDKTLPLITLDTVKNLNVGDEDKVEVSITLKDEEEEITFSRYELYRLASKNEPYPKEKGQKVVIVPKNDKPDTLDNEEQFVIEVNKRLPKKIQQFFFFDGEQLDTYLSNNASKNVEETVLQISQIDLLMEMKDHLRVISDELRREASNTSKDSTEANNNYEKKKEEVESLSNFVDQCREDYNKAVKKINNIDEELGDEPDIAELEIEHKDLENKIDSLDKERKKCQNDIKSFVKRSSTVLEALPNLRKLYDLIKEKEKNDELPPKYDINELEQMLEKNRCFVCNRKLDNDANINIRQLIKRFNLGQETGILLTRLIGSLQALITEASKYKENKELYLAKLESIESEFKKYVKRDKEISKTLNQYTGKNRDKIRKLHLEREALKETRDQLYKDIAIKENELEKAKKEESDLKDILDKLLKQDEKNKKLRLENDLAERAESKVTEIIKSIRDDVKNKISKEMSDKFFELMWKKGFSKVELTDQYSASIIRDDGFECLGSVSAAERELLVLAFTLALHKESGFDGPLVIDTPLSRISGELRKLFANVLKEVSNNKQILLFITEDEYSTQVKDVFENIANNKYEFQLKNESFVESRRL